MGTHKKLTKQEESGIQKWLRAYNFKVPPKVDKDYIGPWSIHPEKKSLRIKRYIKYKDTGRKTWQRLPINFYRHLITNNREMENILILLNEGMDYREYLAKKKFKFKSALIPKTAVLAFEVEIRTNFLNKNKKEINNRLKAFKRYGLKWFDEIEPNPLKWKQREYEWGQALLNLNDLIPKKNKIFQHGELRSKNTIIRVIWMMNKFLKYLYDNQPAKYPLITLNPISNADFAKLERRRKYLNLVRRRRHINPDHWKIIKPHLKKDNDLAIIELCYEFGLRRNEALRLERQFLCIDNLYIKYQIDGDTGTKQDKKLPKGEEDRRIPHHVSSLTPFEMYKIIEKNEVSTLNPSQINFKWRHLMKSLGFDYDIHDCRHSFCRRIVQQYDSKMAMEYAGHKSIETTNGYLQSREEYNSSPFVIEGLG